MRRGEIITLAVMLSLFAIGQAHAQSLRVSPVTIDLPMSVKSSVLTVRNDSTKPLTIQVRMYRWIQKNGQDVLEQTSDVVASPPLLTVSAGADSVVRVARVAGRPVTGEETYRVLLDEVPSREKTQAGGIVIALRQSIPVFVVGLDARASAVNWTAAQHGGKLAISASNAGQKHLKLSEFRVAEGRGRELAKVKGLAGYVLGGQTKTWEFPLPQGGLAAGAALTIEATTDAGPINASATFNKNG